MLTDTTLRLIATIMLKKFYTDAKPVLGSRIYISEAASKVVMAVVVIALPLLILICGIVVWFRRRNL